MICWTDGSLVSEAPTWPSSLLLLAVSSASRRPVVESSTFDSPTPDSRAEVLLSSAIALAPFLTT